MTRRSFAVTNAPRKPARNRLRAFYDLTIANIADILN